MLERRKTNWKDLSKSDLTKINKRIKIAPLCFALEESDFYSEMSHNKEH